MKILLACDQDSFNDAIAQFVTKYPWPPHSVFHIVNVVPAIYDYAYVAAVPELMIELKKDARNTAEQRVRRMALKLRDHFHTNIVKEEIREGNPSQVLLEAAESLPADLIIMGSHGRTGLNRMLMGSVSSAVLEHAPCSVIIIREPYSRDSNLNTKQVKAEARA